MKDSGGIKKRNNKMGKTKAVRKKRNIKAARMMTLKLREKNKKQKSRVSGEIFRALDAKRG